MDTNKKRGRIRTGLIRGGITMLLAGMAYLVMGLMGVAPLELTEIAWNNIRIVSGLAIAGCIMAAVGYGDE
ncbi:MAG: hypothetical protein KJO80_02590 [Gammaproteobacteria bacterium]|nr:hypothetical protein [Gammaproteobacteria bacterium]